MIRFALIFILGIFHSTVLTAQLSVDSIRVLLTELDLSSVWLIQSDSNTITYSYTDTMAICPPDISPGFPDTNSIETYKVKITLEPGWTDKKIAHQKQLQSEISDMATPRILQRCEELEWRVKTNQEWVHENPLHYLNLVKDWSYLELRKISSIQEIPAFRFGDIGVHVWASGECVIPTRKNQVVSNLHLRLKNLGIDLTTIFANRRSRLHKPAHPSTLPDGTYTFNIAFEEWGGKSLGETVKVTIWGDSIRVTYTGEGELTAKPGEVFDSGKIMLHKSGQWIIGRSPEDKNAEQLGGCAGAGPTRIDFNRKLFWMC